jgi:hypothetical protein
MKKIAAFLVLGVMLLSGCDDTTTSSSESITTEASSTSIESNTVTSAVTSHSEPEDSADEIKMTDEEIILFVKENMESYSHEEAFKYLNSTYVNFTPVDNETFLICYAKAINEVLDYIADNSERYFSYSDKIKLSFFEILCYEPYEFIVSYYNENGLPCYDILFYANTEIYIFDTLKGVNYDEQVAFIPDESSKKPQYNYLRTQYTENGNNITEWYSIGMLGVYRGLSYRKTVKQNGEIICEYYYRDQKYYCSEEDLNKWTTELEEKKNNKYTIAPYTSKELTKDDILSDELFDEMILFIYHEQVIEN